MKRKKRRLPTRKFPTRIAGLEMRELPRTPLARLGLVALLVRNGFITKTEGVKLLEDLLGYTPPPRGFEAHATKGKNELTHPED